jgi:dCTP deaminase
MYLSDRDLAWAIQTGRLTVDPPPERIDTTSLDLHLGSIEDAKIWDIQRFAADMADAGRKRPELHVGDYKIGKFGPKYLTNPPEFDAGAAHPVMRRGNEIIVRPAGFLLWPTVEKVGTPKNNCDLICFVDGKSTKARTGMVVHLTAPTIHSTWVGNVVLEIVNLGPFDLVFKQGDAIAQLTVSKITSPPDRGVEGTSATHGQTEVYGKGAL